MVKNLSLRKAVFSDAEQIKDILYSALKEYEIAIPDNYSVSDIDSIETENRREHVFVLEKENVIIGFLVLKPLGRDTIELKRMYLASTQRGRRLGDLLLKFTLNFAKEQNYKSIRLETASKFKEAVSLYKKCGFKEIKDAKKASGHDLAFEKSLKF